MDALTITLSILLPISFVFFVIAAYRRDNYGRTEGGTAGAIAMVTGLICFTYFCIAAVMVSFEYKRDYKSFWDLGVKSSTIKAKSEYIHTFYSKLSENKDKFAPSSAIWLKTPDLDFEKNLEALKSLEERLVKIQDMDENSLAYQTAIQQITGQEQDEAHEMLMVFKECFKLDKSIFLGVLGAIVVLGISLTTMIFGAAITFE
jgi:hypothetical protein